MGTAFPKHRSKQCAASDLFTVSENSGDTTDNNVLVSSRSEYEEEARIRRHGGVESRPDNEVDSK